MWNLVRFDSIIFYKVSTFSNMYLLMIKDFSSQSSTLVSVKVQLGNYKRPGVVLFMSIPCN